MKNQSSSNRDANQNRNMILRRSALMQSLVATGQFLGGVGLACGAISTQPWQKPGQELDKQPETPDEALRFLFEGNVRFAQDRPLAKNRDMARVREVSAQQKPFAAFLGCADSRVPIEIIFDQGFGDLFVTRIAGNVASSENIGSLEFGTHVLGAKVLFVLGHTQCGAVKATMQCDEVPGQISGLFQHIRPAVKAAHGDLEQAILANVRNQAILLAEASPVIARMVQRKELIVAGGIYDLATGNVKPVDVNIG